MCEERKTIGYCGVCVVITYHSTIHAWSSMILDQLSSLELFPHLLSPLHAGVPGHVAAHDMAGLH